MFRKKSKPEPEPKPRIYFEEKDILNLYKHYDLVEHSNKLEDKYKLWDFIYRTLDLDIHNNYTLSVANIMRPYVVEK